MKRYIIAFSLLLVMLGLGAEIHPKAGKYGYQFLGLPAGPMAVAMGGNSSFGYDNGFAWLSQPAAIPEVNGKSVGFSHLLWLDDTALSSLNYANTTRKSRFAIALRNMNYGQIEARDETGNLIGHYQPQDLGISANYARRLGTSLYLGGNLSILYEKLDTASAMALSGDVGMSYLPFIKDSKLGIALRNVGFSGKMAEERPLLPFIAEIQLYKGFELSSAYLGVEAKVAKPIDAGVQSGLGLDLELFKALNLRAGYKFNTDAESFSAGLGIRVSDFVIDYGFALFEEGLNDVHSFGLSYHF